MIDRKSGAMIRIGIGFVAVVSAVGLVLMILYGPAHMTNNTWAVMVFLIGAGIGICLLSAIIAGALRLAAGTEFARGWWLSFVPITLIILISLYVVETMAGG